MKRLILVWVLVLPASFLFAQKEKKYVVKGNELYQQQKFKEAEASYRRSVQLKGRSVEGNFNLGDAFYKQKKFAEAGQQFGKIAASSKDSHVAAQAYHNLGNSLLSSKKIQESIEAYKKALLSNPKDDQTRYNLAYAQQLLKNQQQQKQNNGKQNKDKNQKDQQNKDQKDQNKNQNKQDENKKNQDQKDQQNKQQQQQPNQLSKEDAERMLEALNNQEQGTQDKLKNKKFGRARRAISKDW